MKKLSIMLLAILPLLFISCGNDEKDEPVVQQKQYEITLHNRINKSMVSKMSDGIIYDANIVSQNGQIYTVGNIDNGKDVTYKLPKGYDKSKVMFVIMKLGKNSTSAKSNNYWTPEESYGKMITLRVYDDRSTDLYFTESTTYSSFNCNNILDFKNMLQSILASLGQ